MKSVNISEVIRYASVLSVAFPLLAYLLKSKYASRPVHLIGILVIVSAISDVLGVAFSSQQRSTVYLFNGYYVILFLLLISFYHQTLTENTGKSAVKGSIVVYILSFILITAFIQPFDTYQTFNWTVTGMIMVVLSISYFLHLFSARNPMNNTALLWINSGILYYFSMNLFLFVMSSYVLTKMEPQISNLIWSFHNVNNILKNVLLGFGMIAFTRQLSEANR